LPTIYRMSTWISTAACLRFPSLVKGVAAMKSQKISANTIPVALLAVVAAIWPIQALRAQATATAGQGITGSVTDPTGAAVSEAQVMAQNMATGLEFTATTGDTGYFNFPGLVIGTYRLTVSHTGFQTIVREGITILAGHTPNVDLQLQLGSTTQSVVVHGEAGTIDKTTTVMGETIPKEALQELPVIANGGTRSPLDYLALFGGVSQNAYNGPGRGGNAGLQWSNIEGVGDGGGYGNLTSYKIDGVDQATDQTQPLGGNFAFPKMPAPADIQEVRLLTNISADQGFNLGSVYEIITRSGTQHYHGEAYEYARNDAFDARNFLSQSRPPEKQHDFGATFGGPIPKTNKQSFFFVNYQGFRSNYSSQSSVLTVPTAKMRGGDFTEVLGPQVGTDGLGRPVFQGELFDPATTRPDGQGGFVRDPLTDASGRLNMIPAARFSQVSLFFQNAYPLPNLPGTQNNFATNALPNNTLQDKIYIKTDHNIHDRQRISVAFEDFIRNGTASTCGNVLEGAANYEGFSNDVNNCSTQHQPYKAARLNYTFSIRPDLLLAMNAGFVWDPFGQSLSPEGLTAGARAGLKGTLTTGTPVVTVAQATGFGQQQNKFVGEEYVVPADVSLTWIKNAHEFKFGSQFDQPMYNPVGESFSNGAFGFDGGGTNQPDFTAGGPALRPGYGWADFLLGWVDSGQLQSPFAIHTTSQQWAWFAQDRWRATPKLTVSYGLRWELYIPAHETYNRWSNFCPSCPNPDAGNLLGALQFLGSGPGRIGRNTMMNRYPWAISPRVGIAYALAPSTVVRLYYGVTRYPLNVVQINGGYYPTNGFGVSLNNSSEDGGVTPVFANWDEGTFTPPPVPNLSPTYANGQSVAYYDYNDNQSHPSQNVGAGIEHQFSNGLVLSAKYAGKFMHGLPTNNLVTLNQLPLQYLSLGQLLNQNIYSDAARAADIPIPYVGFNGTVAQALRPYPQYQNVNANDALAKNMYWNALIVGVQQRYRNGLTLMASWTLQKEVSNDPTTWGGQGGASYSSAVQASVLRGTTPLQQIISFGDVGGSRPNTVNVTFNYELPYGRGKAYGNHVNGVVDAILGGWSVAGILSYASGTPEQISATLGSPTLRVWAVRNTGVPIAGSASCSSYDPGNPNSQYINPSAYSNPPQFQLGDTLIETERRGCGIADESLSLFKSFRFSSEGRSLRIGADASNLLNRHTWEFMNGSVGTVGFGRFGGVTSGRAIQLHAQLIF
jgi:hypothetical protein